MKKLAIVSIVLLLAGIGLALGQAGSCNCHSNTACPQTGCTENCGSSCALGTGLASQCAASCPNANCGTAGGCQACCGTNCTACCGAASS